MGFSDIAAGSISVIDLIGNEAADAFAKKGAFLWAYPEGMQAQISYLRGRAWRVGMRLAHVVSESVAAYKSLPPVRAPILKLKRGLL